MRILTMLAGTLFVGAGIFLIANGGITFLSVAFIVGLIFILGGIVECLSYSSYRGDEDDRTWILIDGMTTFLLGGLIVLGKISADSVVAMLLGLWVISTGVSNFVRAWEDIEDRNRIFYDHLIVGLVNLLAGIYVFFDSEIFNMPVIVMVGMCIIVQGINIFNLGATIILMKPEFLKTKQEKLEEAAAKAVEAHAAAKEAIKAAKEAKAEVRVIAETPEEVIDATVAPKPGTEESPENHSDNLQEDAENNNESQV